MYRHPIPASRRHWLRISIRILIVLVLIVGVCLGWMVRATRIQREAVEAIYKAGGKVSYDWEWKYGVHLPGGKPFVPRWLVDLLGPDYFGDVVYVYLDKGGSATDLLHVGHLTQVENVVLNGSFVTDAGLTHLSGLTRLSSLTLDSSRVTDLGLSHLEGLTKLAGLYLDRTQITDAGLSHLVGLTKLVVLSVNDTHVTDAGLVHLKGLTKLAYFNLRDTQVTDAGMESLKQALPTLKVYR
jgi:Leucine Rich repeat